LPIFQAGCPEKFFAKIAALSIYALLKVGFNLKAIADELNRHL
jgi:hypothetical protein